MSRIFRRCLHSNLRSFVYKDYGNPAEVINCVSRPALPEPPKGTVNLKYLLSPINPADLNTIEGVYPSKPSPDSSFSEKTYVAGNEAVAEVTAVSEDGDLKVGDWVIMGKPQRGTWCSSRNLGVQDVVKIRRVKGLQEAHAASIMVNYSSALNLICGGKGEGLSNAAKIYVQNGANSGVGQAVIQMAKALSLPTVNFVRNKDTYESLKQSLLGLGATRVYNYDELADRAIRKDIMKDISDLSGGEGASLAFNCVGGSPATFMTQLLRAPNAAMLTYGNMSKKPFNVPAGLQIFNDLELRGFWQTRVLANQTAQQKKQVVERILKFIEDDQLKAPEHEVVRVSASTSDEEATGLLRGVLGDVSSGKRKKKVMLHVE